jgi:phospholipid/cholesterol/gamma-HCH transport system substrate-binding protein
MELRYRREAAVGLMIVVASVVFVLLMMWLRGQSLRQGQVLRATFDDVAGLKVGDPVQISGVGVGAVSRIELRGAGDVEVTFEVRHGPPAREDAAVSIKAKDFFGARFLDFSPGRSATPLAADRVLRGTRAVDLTEMAAGVVDPARNLMANAGELLGPAMSRDLRAVLVEARRTLQALGSATDRPTRELTGALAELRRVFQRMDQLMAANQQTTTEAVRNVRDLSSNLALATASLTHTSAALDSILTTMNSRRGTLPALLNDSTLYQELRRSNNALTDLLTDLKTHPERYFRLRL